jgi:hypothetical protein
VTPPNRSPSKPVRLTRRRGGRRGNRCNDPAAIRRRKLLASVRGGCRSLGSRIRRTRRAHRRSYQRGSATRERGSGWRTSWRRLCCWRRRSSDPSRSEACARPGHQVRREDRRTIEGARMDQAPRRVNDPKPGSNREDSRHSRGGRRRPHERPRHRVLQRARWLCRSEQPNW